MIGCSEAGTLALPRMFDDSSETGNWKLETVNYKLCYSISISIIERSKAGLFAEVSPRVQPHRVYLQVYFHEFCAGARSILNITKIFPRDVSKFCRDRNIVGSSHGFLERILSADVVVTPEQCQKYYNTCQRCSVL